MIVRFAVLLLVSYHTTAFVLPTHRGWNVPSRQPFCLQPTCKIPTTSCLHAVSDPLEEMSEERKANLFQALLRDLQIENVPLLGVDSNQVHTLQAALWTTMSELADQEDAQKVCLVFEELPVSALRSFVDDFATLQDQPRLIRETPEMKRFQLSLVGKGVGPAIIIETTAGQVSTTASSFDENQVTDSMNKFVTRLVAGMKSCPYTSDSSFAPSNLDGVESQAVVYRASGATNLFQILSGFWNLICELLAEDTIGTLVWSLPGIEAHSRFAALSEWISRSHLLYRGNDVIELLYFHPSYERDEIFPPDLPAHGHIPPLSWLKPMSRHGFGGQIPPELEDADPGIVNYLRRSPVPAIVFKRTAFLDMGTTPEGGVVNLELEDGTTVQASGIPTYTHALSRLSQEGPVALQEALDSEMPAH